MTETPALLISVIFQSCIFSAPVKMYQHQSNAIPVRRAAERFSVKTTNFSIAKFQLYQCYGFDYNLKKIKIWYFAFKFPPKRVYLSNIYFLWDLSNYKSAIA